MKKLLPLLISVMSLIPIILSPGCNVAEPEIEPPPGWVHGYVYEAGTNTPLDSVQIIFTADTIYTSENGYYISSPTWPVTHNLHVIKSGYSKDSAKVRIIPEDTINHNFYLHKE
jgi:hypothetical protein